MFERFNGNVVPFADESTSTNRTVFGSEIQSDDIDDNLNADFKKGWEIVGLNDNPTREDFNAMGYTLGYLTSYLYQNGVAEYNLLQEYKTNSIAIGTDGNIYQSLVDNNLGNALTDTTKWVCIASKNSIVNSIAELKTISNIESINVLGYYEKGDGGGGTFYWDANSTETDNGGTIIQATGVTTGRWKRADSIDLKFPNVGTTNKHTQYSYIASKSALRIGGSDTTDLNDERGYWSGLHSRDSWGDLNNIGEFSVAFNRNGASFGIYSTTFGHDCVAYGTASLAGGAGSCVGDPTNPTSSNFEGYCSISFGKNNITKGEKSCSFGEENKALGRASTAIGYSNEAGELGVDIGAIAMGYNNIAKGDGSVALGRYTESNDSIIIGLGLNPGSKLKNDRKGSVGLGSGRTTPSLFINGDSTVEVYETSLSLSKQFSPTSLLKNSITPVLTNSGGNGYVGTKFSITVDGTETDILLFDAGLSGGIASILPVADSAFRIGSASNRWAYVFSTGGVITTSDDRVKKYLDITEIEKKVALELKANMKKFKMLDSISEKGEDKARIHFGTSAQTVKSIFEKYGLNAFDYSLLCYDEWDEIKNEKDEITREKGNLYGINYNELLSFIVSCM